jgi:hypothetical protein
VQDIGINWLALILAVIARMIIGMLWYSPPLFGPSFLRLTGCTPDELRARLPMALLSDFIGALIMAFILAQTIAFAGAASLVSGATIGLFCWLGFISVTHFALVMYEKRPYELFLINNGYQALTLAVMGGIIGALH